MIIDNRFSTAQIRILYMVLLGLFLIILIYGLVDHMFYRPYYLGISALVITGYFFMHLLGLYYIYFNDDQNKVVIRFYYAHPFMRTYKAMEIPKNQISGYQIKKSLFGMRKELTIQVQSFKGSGQYPQISLSLLGKTEINKIEKSLNKIILANKK